MKRRDFITATALSACATLPLGARAGPLSDHPLYWRCIRLPGGGESAVRPEGLRLDFLDGLEPRQPAMHPGVGLKAVFSGPWPPQEFILIHPAGGDLQHGGQLHFTPSSLAGLEAELDGRRAYLPRAALFGRKPRPGEYSLILAGERRFLSAAADTGSNLSGNPVTLRFRLVAV